MFAQALYVWLVVFGIIDALLVAPALANAAGQHTTGRLLATLAVLSGLVLASLGRLFIMVPLTPWVLVGLIFIDAGLLGYALFLPEHGVLGLWRRWRG